MSKIGKNNPSSHGSKPSNADEGDGGNKNLSTTLLQEFQNLKDNLNKFKNEDDNQDRGTLLIVQLFIK